MENKYLKEKPIGKKLNLLCVQILKKLLLITVINVWVENQTSAGLLLETTALHSTIAHATH